jgi:hypothetical protein
MGTIMFPKRLCQLGVFLDAMPHMFPPTEKAYRMFLQLAPTAHTVNALERSVFVVVAKPWIRSQASKPFVGLKDLRDCCTGA